MNLREVQIDRLVGPTHHFGGLGVGNVASQLHAGQTSSPRAAALQGLDKMRLVASLGAIQWILPPQPRPDHGFLRALGFGGTDADVLRKAYNEAPHLLSAATSCSAMWTANAATVSPGIDSGGGPTQLTVANLDASLHRAIEPRTTSVELARILPRDGFVVHRPLPGGAAMRDEGAANHMRLSGGNGGQGIHVFVHGDGDPLPKMRWPRQSLDACRAVARLHRLPQANTFFLKQHAEAIDAGAFHNDVVAMSHENLLIHHQTAFAESAPILEQLEEQFRKVTGADLIRVEVDPATLSIDDAVNTYLFNSQIVSPIADVEARPVIVCASQVQESVAARRLVDRWCADGIFGEAKYVDLNQSMSGGGGPACLRLRIPLTPDQIEAMDSSDSRGRWSESLDSQLREVIEQDYATALTLEDLASEQFHRHASRAQARVVKLITGG